MHYCFLVFTKERPDEETLNIIMNPYNEDTFYERREKEKIPFPEFTWDYFVVGGRYNSQLKFDFKKHYKEDEHGMFYAKKTRNHKIFDSFILDKIKRNFSSPRFWEEFEECDYYASMGIDDGYIRVDGCKISELHDSQDKNLGYGFIGIDGSVYSRTWYNGDADECFVKRPDYEDVLAKAWEKATEEDGWVTVLDIHD